MNDFNHDDDRDLKSSATISVPDEAAAYYHAAIQDEINGYELTAAMEWQQAAELVAQFPFVAAICWQQWERITHLPRRLATPILSPSRNTPSFELPSIPAPDTAAA